MVLVQMFYPSGSGAGFESVTARSLRHVLPDPGQPAEFSLSGVVNTPRTSLCFVGIGCLA
jgi:hypothetical protein